MLSYLSTDKKWSTCQKTTLTQQQNFGTKINFAISRTSSITSQQLITIHAVHLLFFSKKKNVIHFMQGWKTTTRHVITTKRRMQWWTAYSKTSFKETKDIWSLLTQDLKPFRSKVKEKHCTVKEFQGLNVWGKNCWHWDPYNINGDTWIMQPIRITRGPRTRIRKWSQFNQFRSTKVIPIKKMKAG